MKRYILFTLLICVPTLHAFHRKFEDTIKAMQEWENHSNRMQKSFVHSLKKSESTTGPKIASETTLTDNGEQISIKNVEAGHIEATVIGKNIIRVKHPQFTAYIERGKRNMIMVQLEVQQKEAVTDDDHRYQTFYYLSQTENRPLKNPVDLEQTTIIHDKEKNELIINLVYEMQKQIPITIKEADQPAN